ncbi:hypothetical protein GALL_377780 [mine drainage metagenome]|uniref:Uncharacterized protein n=1 Tax=mine drainage metagenome TaxID=410659 RepID=A0A1J5QKF6_9ZZZZ
MASPSRAKRTCDWMTAWVPSTSCACPLAAACSAQSRSRLPWLPESHATRTPSGSSQSASWMLKSNGEVKVRPGRNEVSKNPLRRSTRPLNSGSRAGASLIRTPSVPANDAASTVSLPVPPIADSRSQTSVRGQAPHPLVASHIPAKMSPALREGIIIASVTRENPQVIASTGRIRSWPPPTGIGTGGNHRSHWATSPGAYSTRSAGSTPANNGRSSRIRSLRIVNDPVQPIRSAITVAGIVGNSASSTRTRASTASTLEPRDARSYFGGRSEANALDTVFREIPNRLAIPACEMPSDRCSRRISAQFSTVITPQAVLGVLKIHPSITAQFSAVVDNRFRPPPQVQPCRRRQRH